MVELDVGAGALVVAGLERRRLPQADGAVAAARREVLQAGKGVVVVGVIRVRRE